MSDPLIVVCPACQAANRVPAARLDDGGKCGKCGQALFTGAPLELDQAGFERHLGHSDLPLVVDFWAPWCGPCRSMTPAYAQAAARLEPHYRLAKVNTEDQPALAGRFAIRSIPTLAIFKRGREVARSSGAMDAGSLIRWIRDKA